VIFSERAAATAQRMARLAPLTSVQRVTSSLIDAVRRYAHHHRELIRVLSMSVLVQAARILQAWCLGRSLGIDLPLVTYFAFMPVIMLVMQLPITINGFGTAQVAFSASSSRRACRQHRRALAALPRAWNPRQPPRRRAVCALSARPAPGESRYDVRRDRSGDSGIGVGRR
jgi:hypothetical protein